VYKAYEDSINLAYWINDVMQCRSNQFLDGFRHTNNNLCYSSTSYV